MIEQTYVLTIRDAPKSINQGGGGTRVHHMAAYREKQRWEGRYLMELLAARVQKHMEFCSVDVTLRFKHRAGKGRDEENYRQPVLKPLADALQKGSYLQNDTAEWFGVEGFRLEEGVSEWPYTDPRVKAELIVKITGSYL